MADLKDVKAGDRILVPGYEIGQASMSHINKYAKPYLERDDESELLTKWEERQDAERAIYKALQFLKVPNLDDDQIKRLNDLLASFKGSD